MGKHGSKSRLIISNATAQGGRSHQEDRFVVLEDETGTLAAVFDGHGGDECAIQAVELLRIRWEKGKDNEDVKSRILDSVAEVAKETAHLRPGASLSLAFIPKGTQIVYAAVLGDSPVLAKLADGSLVHGPEHNARTNLAEREEAVKRGAFYQQGYLCHRWDGLQMSRALGDSHLPFLLKTPEIKVWPKVETLIVATDGLLDPTHDSFDDKGIWEQVESGADAQGLVETAVNKPTHDNVTAILVKWE